MVLSDGKPSYPMFRQPADRPNHNTVLLLARGRTFRPDSLYGYVPTEWICILFVVLFSLTYGECIRDMSAILCSLTCGPGIHTSQALYYRLWWLHLTAGVGGILEILGWVGRLWSSFNPGALNPYLMQ